MLPGDREILKPYNWQIGFDLPCSVGTHVVCIKCCSVIMVVNSHMPHLHHDSQVGFALPCIAHDSSKPHHKKLVHASSHQILWFYDVICFFIVRQPVPGEMTGRRLCIPVYFSL